MGLLPEQCRGWHLRCLCLLVISVLLSGCGFRLAGTADLPTALTKIHLASSGFSSSQQQQLVERLQQAGARLTSASEVPTLSVKLFGSRETTLFDSSDNTQTRRLVQQLSYQVRAADGTLMQEERRLRQESDLEIDHLNIVASHREKAELQAQMLDQLISRMIYQLQRM